MAGSGSETFQACAQLRSRTRSPAHPCPCRHRAHLTSAKSRTPGAPGAVQRAVTRMDPSRQAQQPEPLPAGAAPSRSLMHTSLWGVYLPLRHPRCEAGAQPRPLSSPSLAEPPGEPGAVSRHKPHSAPPPHGRVRLLLRGSHRLSSQDNGWEEPGDTCSVKQPGMEQMH